MAPAVSAEARARLEQHVGAGAPGLQYVVLGPEGIRLDYAAGWADIRQRRVVTPATTFMAYSMTKTITAIAILQLVEREQLQLDDDLDRHLPDTPYRHHGISIRQLLAHTAGLPNPIPLRWVHLVEEADTFDEAAALDRVVRSNPRLIAPPGRKYAYSNIGYWLLGRILERVAAQTYADYVHRHIIAPLGLSAREMGFAVADPSQHAKGYLARFSLTNLFKGLVTDRKLWGEYEGNWLQIRSHQVNGPAFGGLVGTARAFGRLLQDQLVPNSVLLGSHAKQLLESPQITAAGRAIPMTLGWHVGATAPAPFLFKEGGGGGFHGEMRLYPRAGLASVVLTNGTDFHSSRFLNAIDPVFLDAAR